MESLFELEKARRRRLPSAMRRFIVDLKAEHPRLNVSEMANIVYVRFGRRPDARTIMRVLAEEPLPLKILKRFSPYHDTPEPKERRMAVVKLHAEGWSVKAIASYLKTSKPTVYRALRKWIREGMESLDDKKRGPKSGVRKVDLAAIEAIRRLRRNPGLGEFRVHGALAQIGIHLSPRTCGRILALNRGLYGYDKPKSGGGEKKPMPFASERRHEYWSADIRYIDHGLPTEGNVYVIQVLENHSRAILASALSRSQDTSTFLSVFHRAIERYGSPETLVTDSGSVFLSGRARTIYEALNVRKEEIEKGRPWQNYAETTFNIQRRMADFHFARAEDWEGLLQAHDHFMEDYNVQSHWAHRERKDGKLSPREVLGWLTEVRHHPEDLRRAFFSTRFARRMDGLGYVTFRRWRLYGEEGLAGSVAALWLGAADLTIEYDGQPLSRYDVERQQDNSEAGGLRTVTRPTLFETSHLRSWPQPKLFELNVLGESGWLKVLKLDEYAPRRPRKPLALQQVLFAYTEAI